MESKVTNLVVKSRIEYCTIGPVPITGIVTIIQQLNEQDWKAEHVAFSGMIAIQGKIALQNQPTALPSYLIIGVKLYAEGEAFVPPNINLGGGIAGK